MDADRFDRWTRLLAAASRRAALRGAALARLVAGEAVAQAACRPAGKRCERRGDCCTKIC